MFLGIEADRNGLGGGEEIERVTGRRKARCSSGCA